MFWNWGIAGGCNIEFNYRFSRQGGQHRFKMSGVCALFITQIPYFRVDDFIFETVTPEPKPSDIWEEYIDAKMEEDYQHQERENTLYEINLVVQKYLPQPPSIYVEERWDDDEANERAEEQIALANERAAAPPA
jgi:hypothetical protein